MNETTTSRWICCDGDGAEVIYEAVSPSAAAQEYIEDGDWGERTGTSWHDVRVIEVGLDDEPLDPDDEGDIVTVTQSPTEPDCGDSDESEHEWCSPHELLGGIAENPGCWGHGGGVIITTVCCRCGRYRDKDTWAQRPDTGQQGLESVTYREADEASRYWVESQSDED